MPASSSAAAFACAACGASPGSPATTAALSCASCQAPPAAAASVAGAGAAAVAAGAALMGRLARARLSDGRVLRGTLTCLDWQGNLLLSDASLETDPAAAQEDGGGGGNAAARALGVAVIPAQHLVACELVGEGEGVKMGDIVSKGAE
jgi:small nuclear ribonucleoprotein (snRNP)-like protein